MQSYVLGHLYKGGRADKGLENKEGKSTLWSINTEIRDIEEELHWQFFFEVYHLFHYSVIATLRAGFQADNAEEKAFWESSL